MAQIICNGGGKISIMTFELAMEILNRDGEVTIQNGKGESGSILDIGLTLMAYYQKTKEQMQVIKPRV